jgi:hypothetical protein
MIRTAVDAKLSMAMIDIFIERLKTFGLAKDGAVDDLRHLHSLLSERAPIRMSWSRLSEQNLRVDKWSLCRG